MKKNLLAVAIIATFFSFSAFAAPLVTVNGQSIDKSQVDTEMQNLIKRSNGQIKDTPEAREIIKNQMINQILIKQEARKRGLQNTKEFKAAINNVEEQFLTEALFADVVKNNPVTDAEAKKLYDELANNVKGTQEVQLGQIIVNSSADVKKVLNELAKGTKFEKVAATYSIDPSAKENGGLVANYTNMKDFETNAPEIYKNISSLKKGEYTKEAIEINGKPVIFKLNDKRNAVLPPFNDVKDALKNQLMQQKVVQLVNELRQKASIK